MFVFVNICNLIQPNSTYRHIFMYAVTNAELMDIDKQKKPSLLKGDSNC